MVSGYDQVPVAQQLGFNWKNTLHINPSLDRFPTGREQVELALCGVCCPYTKPHCHLKGWEVVNNSRFAMLISKIKNHIGSLLDWSNLVAFVVLLCGGIMAISLMI